MLSFLLIMFKIIKLKKKKKNIFKILSVTSGFKQPQNDRICSNSAVNGQIASYRTCSVFCHQTAMLRKA